MLKFVRTGRKETTYSAGLHPVIKAGLRADHGEHTVFIPFRLESINTQHNVGVLVSGNGYSHGIVVTDHTKEGKKFKITSNVEKYNIYIDGQKYDGRELDFGQIYTLSFSAELGTLVHLGASKLVTADFYQGIKVFSERKLEGESIVAEHTKWTTKYGEEKTKTLAAIEAAKLVPVQPKPATPETPKQVNPNIPNNNILELGEGDRAKFGIYTFNLVLSDNETQTSQSDGKGELKISVVKSNPPVAGYIFYATDNEEERGQPNYVAQTDKPVKKPASETSSDTTGNQPAATEQPAVTQLQPVVPVSPQPAGESGQTEKPVATETEGNKPASETEQPSSAAETNTPVTRGNTENSGTEDEEETAKKQEANGMYTFNLKNTTEESVKSDGEGLTVRAVATFTPVVGYKLIVKEDK